MESIEKLGDLTGKTALVRCDLNVPLNEKGEITDDRRIREAVPTINDLLSRGAKVIVTAHLGRPGGKADPAFSLAPVAQRLSELLGAPVILAKDAAGEDSKKLAKELKPGEVLLLENIRFRPEETSKDEEERMKLAKYQRLPQASSTSITIDKGMDKLKFIMEHTGTNEQMVLRALQPIKEVAHQHRDAIGRRCQMYQPFLTKHAYATSAVVSCIIHESLHHHTVRLQQVFLLEGIERRIQLVGLDGILYFLNLTDGRHHVLAIDDVAHLIL